MSHALATLGRNTSTVMGHSSSRLIYIRSVFALFKGDCSVKILMTSEISKPKQGGQHKFSTGATLDRLFSISSEILQVVKTKHKI
ncbi:MAG: hypothetical protein JSC189_000976 [Candidatus Tokpelaia sp. JSC189]|nr:MAG: hypothetical protein JSC189_000976 [Candidatus Tokpelaia sp. JSC189]